MKTCKDGLTLMEIVVALIILTAVVYAMTHLVIGFGNTSSNISKNEGALMGAKGAFEDIVSRVTEANQITFPVSASSVVSDCAVGVTACSIEVRVAPRGSAATADHTSDTYHYYWQSGNSTTQNNQLMYGSRVGSPGVPTTTNVLVRDLSTLSFSLPSGSTMTNIVQVDLEVQHKDATDNLKQSPKETLSTVVVARSRSSQ
jgi:hypothetical protein